ncbi:hypothetical protein [Winogradskyella sp. PG-2]|uniref:hypothetical protein n=1 Tax=Winogradskyella sp. PG-2 TaxID=754409 RepID=UPI0004589398|nr:hypothetical protein [Winogradskyella sp. PG-2]BAO74923.1 hypothetical protein WPG_0693 [Winogradskyella sp. PG-2]
MIKKIYTLLILCSTVFGYGQHITLLKNYNPKAQELKHSLNHSRDSLLMECESTILKIEIFNEDYEKTTIVDAPEIKISLIDLPAGKFVIEAKLVDKSIIMDLIKYDFEYKKSTQSKEVAEGKGMMLDENLKLIKSTPKRSIESLLTRGKRKKITDRKQKYYWVINEVNNDLGARKTMKLVNQESADKMIKRNRLENNSVVGKLNELTVWEVYNTQQFMKRQISNPDFVYSSSSDFFNVDPYYSKETSIQNP